MKPILKWAGSKKKLLPEIIKRIPKEFSTYVEPFFGSGAVFFALRPSRAFLSDYNGELISFYKTLRDFSKELIEELRTYENTKEYFDHIRSLDRDLSYKGLSDIKKAARFLYLNKTCFNGLYRVNSKGHFNVPFGKYINPSILNEPLLEEVSTFLGSSYYIFNQRDFRSALKDIPKDSFVYLDPPYDGTFTEYTKKSFGKKDQEDLRDCCIELDRQGIKFLLSNSNTEFIKELYKDFIIEEIKTTYAINHNKEASEVLIRNYEI
jgi:DNA adenine methylase